MTKFCKNCGNELDEGSVFCEECGTKLNEDSPNTGSNFSNSKYNPFNLYKLDMIPGEKVIRNSEIHIGCLIAPGIIFAIGIFWMLFVFLVFGSYNVQYGYDYYSSVGAFFIGITSNPALIIGAIWLIIRFIGYINTDLILTDKRVFGKCGLISTVQMQSPLNKIDTVSFSNGLMGKFLGYGTVTISTTSSHFKFRFIKDGHTLYNDIFHQLEINEKEMMDKQADAIAEAISKK